MTRIEASLRIPGRRDPVTLAGDAQERVMFDAIARHGGRYESALMRTVARLVPGDGVVVDAGAHIGAFALAAAHAAPRGRVLAVEPGPRHAALLRENVARNGAANVDVIQAALGDAVGTVGFASNEHYSSGSTVAPDGDVRVQATTLDRLVAERGVRRLDLVKADVEGSEPGLLRGGHDTLRRLRPALVLEVNPMMLRRVAGEGPRALWDALADLYPRRWWVGPGGALIPLRGYGALRRALRREQVGDIVCAHRRPGAPGPRALAGRTRHAVPTRGPRYAVDGRIDLRAGDLPGDVRSGSEPAVLVRVANRTGVTLDARGPHPFGLAVRLRAPGGAVVEGPRVAPPRPLRDGRAADVAVGLPPAGPGEYDATLAALYEGYTWLDDMGPGAALRWRVRVG